MALIPDEWLLWFLPEQLLPLPLMLWKFLINSLLSSLRPLPLDCHLLNREGQPQYLSGTHSLVDILPDFLPLDTFPPLPKSMRALGTVFRRHGVGWSSLHARPCPETHSCLLLKFWKVSSASFPGAHFCPSNYSGSFVLPELRKCMILSCSCHFLSHARTWDLLLNISP